MLTVLAAKNISFIEQLKYIKSKIFHEQREKEIDYEDDDNYENIHNDNTDEDVYTFQTVDNAELWIDKDPLFDKQKCTFIKFLLSKDVVRERDKTDNDDEKPIIHGVRLFIVGSKKNPSTGNSYWTEFLKENIIKPVNILTTFNDKIRENITQKTIWSAREAISTFVNQEKLQYNLHGVGYDRNIINLISRNVQLHLFEDNDDLRLWREDIDVLIAKRQLNVFDIYYSESKIIQVNKYNKMNSSCFYVILNIIQNLKQFDNNILKDDEKEFHFIELLLKSHALYALEIASLINIKSRNKASLVYYKMDSNKLLKTDFLLKRGQVNIGKNKFASSNTRSLSSIVQFINGINLSTIVDFLDNPLTNQSQLFRSSFGPLIGLDGTSKKNDI